MEVQNLETEPECQPMEGDPIVVLDEPKLREVITSGSLDFDEWISLISEIEKEYSDDIEKICLVYDSFLSQFPLCYGYWRKYANHKMRLCTVDKVVEVFEQAVKSATYSVDLWVDYCSFGSLVFEDPSDVRRLFKRGMSFVGKDYLCHTLWDKYIEFEFSQQHWSSLAHIYIQTLMFPTKKLHRYYDSFKKLVGIWEEEMESCCNSTSEALPEPVLDGKVSTNHKQDNLSCIIKELLDPSIGLARFKALQKYIYIGEQFYNEASQLNEKINCFETRIRRSYFHVKPLDVSQLENWHHYLDFAELHQDFDWAVKLYERCLIPCANYPEFWMRYVEFMERKGGREIATFAMDRATQIFLKRVSVIHLFNARFKEHIGDVSNARAAYLQCDTESDSDFVENVVMKANMERRLGNFIVASNTYKEALEMAAAKAKFDILPILYVHFSQLKYMTADGEDAARDILVDGIKNMPYCKLLIEELIKFAMTCGGSRHINLVDSIIANALSPEPGASEGLSAKDAEHISRLYIEFVDLCGTVHDVRKAWNQHIRLFPHSVRTNSFLPARTTKMWKVSMEAPQETPVNLPCQPSRDCSSDCMIHPSLQDKKPTSLENNDMQAVHPGTEQVSDQKSPLLENCMMLSGQDAVDLHQSGDSDNNVQESLHQVSPKVSEPPKEDSSEPNVSLDSVHQVTNETEGAQASLEFSRDNDVQQEYDHETEQDLKPLSLERLCLDPQDTKSSGPVTPKSYDSESEAPQEISPFPPTSHDTEAPQEMSDRSVLKSETTQENSMSDRSMTESGQNANVDNFVSSPVSTQATVSAQINIGNFSPSTSASNQNVMTEALSQPRINWRQKGYSDRNRRDSKFGFRGHSHKRLHQQRQVSPRQYPRADIGSHLPTSQGYPSQPLSSPNPQIQQGGHIQSQYPASTAHPNLTAPQAWPMQSVQQQNLSPASQSQSPVQPAAYSLAQMSQHPMQNNEQDGNMQNNQAYNQMWQYYYYQQQQLLWQQQQQQPQQQQLLQQQYQQQLLQLQYLQQQQLQQQQLPYQQQQLQQHQQQQQEQQLQPQQQQQQQPYPLQQQLLQQQPNQLQQFQQQHLLYLQQQQQLQLQHQQHKQLQLQLQQQQHNHQQQTAPPQQQQQHEQKQGQAKQQIVTSHIQDAMVESGQQTLLSRVQVTPPHGAGTGTGTSAAVESHASSHPQHHSSKS